MPRGTPRATIAAAILSAVIMLTPAAPTWAAPAGAPVSGDGLEVVGRAAWDPGGRCPAPHEREPLDDIRLVVVHHTVQWASHRPQDGPAVMRELCDLHRRRGFSDIGYHFAVDRYGVVYEGRAGSFERPRKGAHAQGINHVSMGVVLIGNFDREDVPAPAMESLERVLGWLTQRHGIDPTATTRMVAGGGPASRFRPGTPVRLPTIAGHEDSGRTVCPGRYLHARMEGIGQRVAALRSTGPIPVVYRTTPPQPPAPPSPASTADSAPPAAPQPRDDSGQGAPDDADTPPRPPAASEPEASGLLRRLLTALWQTAVVLTEPPGVPGS